MRNRTRIARAAAVAVALVSLAAGASTAGASDKAGFPGLQKRLTGQSKLLVAFTTEFKADAEQLQQARGRRRLRLRRAVGHAGSCR